MLPRSLARSMYMIADAEASFDFSFRIFFIFGLNNGEKKLFSSFKPNVAPNSRKSTNCNVQYNICCVYGDLTRFFQLLSDFSHITELVTCTMVPG